MTRVQFLNDLYRRLGASMPKDEAEQHLTYYAEMLADRMEEGMTEEEAVASMEDVETIAGRILRDRAEGAEPPRYPDPPRREPDPVSERPAAPPRRRRWVGVVIGLGIALAVLPTLLGIIGLGSYQGIHIGNDGIRIGGLISIDNSGIRLGPGGSFVSVTNEGIEVGPGGSAVSVTDHGVEVGPDGSVVSITGEGIAVGGDAVAEVPTVEEVVPEWTASEVYNVDTKDVQKLVVNWVSGDVDVFLDDGDTVGFYETTSASLDESETLRYTLQNGVLTIDYADSSLKTIRGSKALTVRLPRSLVLRELKIDTVSADCYAEALCKRAELNSTSGEVHLVWCGDLKEVDFNSVSGDLLLELPRDAGFELTFDSVSGSLDSGNFSFQQSSDGVYKRGDKGLEIKANTVSGDVVLMEQ